MSKLNNIRIDALYREIEAAKKKHNKLKFAVWVIYAIFITSAYSLIIN